ncbi:hypothetical protein, partial [Piscirickettsia salmonis]
MKKSSILSSLLLFTFSPAFTFANTNISLNTSAHIIAPITLEIEQLEFGTLIKPQSGRTNHEAALLRKIIVNFRKVIFLCSLLRIKQLIQI